MRAFAALGDRTRLALVEALAPSPPRSIAELTRGTRLTRQAVTKHLRVLQRAGMVRCARFGREARFALEPQTVLSLGAYLDRVTTQWDAALLRLKAQVE